MSQIKNTMVTSLSSSKLTGALPAVDGSAITGVSPFIKNASDPATDTNPTDGVGTVWANTTSGEMYVLTDATTDANVWINVGAGTGDVALVPCYQGEIAGFASGGHNGANTSIICRFSFTSDADATLSGNLVQTGGTRQDSVGNSSATHAYSCGGSRTGAPEASLIDKFPFASGGNSTAVADLTTTRSSCAGASSCTHGYVFGGYGVKADLIEKFIFASDGNGVDIANMTIGRGELSGNNSTTHGYVTAGAPADSRNVTIDKFTFAADADATDVGDLTIGRSNTSGASSTTYGYVMSGYTAASLHNTIDKYSFSSDGNATDSGDLTSAKSNGTGVSSSTHGYHAGGYPHTDVIEKFSWASEGNTVDVGDLTTAKYTPAGQQY